MCCEAFRDHFSFFIPFAHVVVAKCSPSGTSALSQEVALLARSRGGEIKRKVKKPLQSHRPLSPLDAVPAALQRPL